MVLSGSSFSDNRNGLPENTTGAGYGRGAQPDGSSVEPLEKHSHNPCLPRSHLPASSGPEQNQINGGTGASQKEQGSFEAADKKEPLDSRLD